MVGMLSGQCQLNFATISTAIPHVRAGKLRALAVTTTRRSVAAPEFPTIAEAGVPGYEHASWVGLLATAKVPQPIIARLNAAAIKAAHSPDVKAALLKDGLEATGTTPGEFAQIIKTEVAKWIKVTKAAGITAQ
jgi:tripartite-type tricarboxylate transporter receptor subunit TctC